MTLETVLSLVIDATGAFNARTAIVLYAICTVGELGPSIPYLLETIWLMAGYHLARGVLSPFDMMLFWVVAQAGRQTGSAGLYTISRFGSPVLMKLYKRYLESRLAGKQIIPAGVLRRLTNLTPFSVALGRLFGLRIPLALTLGAKRRLPLLSLGVLMSSVIWDGIYLFFGITVGATFVGKPETMILYSLAGLTVLYVVTFAIRLIVRLRSTGRSN